VIDEFNAERLVGTWMLVSASAADSNGRPLRPPYGPEPMGRVVFTATGRMMAVLGDGRNDIPAGENRSFVAYCGNFRIENGALTTVVDAASVPALVGNHEVRALRWDGENLVLIPPPRRNGERRELVWQRSGRG
jgi:hypothetical protein